MIQRFSNHQNDRIPDRIAERRGLAVTAKAVAAKAVTAGAVTAGAVTAKPTVSAFEQDVHTALIGGAAVSNNPLQFATADAAAALAKKLGGEVREDNLSGTFSRSSPQRMIVVAGANPINAGLAAGLFAFYGDAPDSEAWRIINRDLGRGKS